MKLFLIKGVELKMILELKLKDGGKFVMGGNFSFIISKEKHLIVTFNGYLSDYVLKDYPVYNVGGTIIYCEEAKDD